VVRNRFMVLVLFLVFLRPFDLIASSPPIMSLEEAERLIDASQFGSIPAYFKTVSRGTAIKHYNINLRGVYREPGLKVIMFTISTPIVAGMSGSPVYVNGKNIGAVAYGFNNFAKTYWGGISPISEMMKESEAGAKPTRGTSAFSYQGMLFEPIGMGNRLVKGLESISGGKFMVTASSSVKGNSFGKNPVLKAGLPIVVDLIEWTDEKGETVTVGGLGTITYIDDKGKIFAFGHPFLNSKNVVYGFRTAEIIGTVFSQNNSFKLGGEKSDILGAITFDADYGISGRISSGDLAKLHHFKLEFKNEGKIAHSFDIKVADSILTPILAQAAFRMIGDIYGAPLNQEVSVTQVESKVNIDGQKPILWKGLFASNSTKFGTQTLYISSYSAAYNAFFAGIYGFLFENNYGLKISDVSMSVDFIHGANKVFKLGAYKFPSKVVYGQNPVLDILLIDENNLMPIAKKISVKIDWSKVERPVYTKETVDTDKVPEKTVQGMLRINGAQLLLAGLSDNEKQKFFPGYFLSPEDFLENLSSRLEITSQKLFVRVAVRAKSGLFDEAITSAKDIMPSGVSVDDSEWQIIEGGLKERKVTVKNEGVVIFNVNLPDIPKGYVVDQLLDEFFLFEIVLN